MWVEYMLYLQLQIQLIEVKAFVVFDFLILEYLKYI